MKLFLYILIFLSKVIENALATLRLIVVANGKKVLGAVLQFCIALVWIFVTGVVITDLSKDPLKIFFFALGSFVGSYVGSIIEEKLAMGNNLITITTSLEKEKSIIQLLERYHYRTTSIDATQENRPKKMILLFAPRKQKKKIVTYVHQIDQKANMIAEKVIMLKEKI